MKKLLSKLPNSRWKKASLLAVAAAAFSIQSAQAQDVAYVTTYTGSALNPCPPVCKIAGSYSTFGSTSLSTAPGIPSRTKCTYGYSSDLSVSIQPTLAVPGAIYKIEVAKPTASSSPDVLMTATTADGQLSPSCVNSPVFGSSYNASSWHLLGYITNNPGVTQPTITLTVSGGAAGPTSSANRVYFDAFKFTEVNPCSGVAPDATINGPLAAGQTFVNVAGVDGGSSQVTVYADGSEIGSISAPNIVAGVTTVPVSALYYGAEIKARQTKNGCTSPMPSSGPKVGNGANPPVIVSLSLWKSPTFTGPIGANTSSNLSTNYILKAMGLRGGSQTAPVGGHVLNPNQCWETVTFNHTGPTPDSAIYPNNGFTVESYDPFAALDALVFAIDESSGADPGPYDIYVDRIMNGDVVIEDFESYAVNTTNFFRAPNATATPAPGATYLPGVNSSLISTNNAFDGSKAVRIRWQFADQQPIRWARIIANATTGKNYPKIDTSKPITIRYLVLPVGQTEDKLSFPTVPQSQTVVTNGSVTFTVAAAGDGPYTYQWKYEGADIPNATTSSYTKTNVQLSDAGLYSVTVFGATCNATHEARLTVTEFVAPPTLVHVRNGNQITFSWSGSFNLQEASAVTGPWNTISSSSGHSVSTSTGTKFYRLSQ